MVKDNALFEQYYTKFYYCTYQSAYRIVKDNWVAEDITAQVFVKLYERFPMYKEIGDIKFRALCCVCAKNEALDYLRRKKLGCKALDGYKQMMEVTSTLGIPEKETLEKEKTEIINNAFISLPTSYRDILNLRYDKEMSIDQISKYLEITPKNAEVRLRRARQNLKAVLSKCLVAVILSFVLINSDAYAQINNYVIAQIADKYFLVTQEASEDITKDTAQLVCDYVPYGYELTKEVQREDISFLQYVNKNTYAVFFVDRVRAGIDYQLNYEDYNLKLMNYQGNFAIFFEGKEEGESNQFLWYDKSKGYIFSITHRADLEKMKEIAEKIH